MAEVLVLAESQRCLHHHDYYDNVVKLSRWQLVRRADPNGTEFTDRTIDGTTNQYKMHCVVVMSGTGSSLLVNIGSITWVHASVDTNLRHLSGIAEDIMG